MSTEPVAEQPQPSCLDQDLLQELVDRVTQLEAENEALRDRVAELEAQPRLEWKEESPANIKIYHPEQEFPFPIGSAAKGAPDWIEEDLDQLESDVQALKREAVDELDLVTTGDAKLPIEATLAKMKDETLRSELSANEERAIKIFRKFGGRADSWSGTLTLTSSDVKTILEETGEPDPNPNTVKRAMQMVAKKTSTASKDDRDAYDQEKNLLWLHRGEKRLQLRATKEEWLAWMEEVSERYGKP
jgi:hypothetical protein